MDPLSAIASVIAVLQAGDRTFNILVELVRLKYAPTEAAKVAQDLSEMKAVVGGCVNTFTEVKDSNLWSSSDVQELVSIVHKLQDLVFNLETFLQRTMYDTSGRIRRLQWTKHRSRIIDDQSQISKWTSVATVHIARLNLTAQLRNGINSNMILAKSTAIQRQQEVNHRALQNRLDSQQALLTRLALGQNPLQYRTAATVETCPNNKYTLTKADVVDRIRNDQMSLAQAINPQLLVCRSGCKCRCHPRKTGSIHYQIYQLIRALLENCMEQLIYRPACDIESCSRRSLPLIVVAAVLPKWFTWKVAALVLNLKPTPSVALWFPRWLPANAEVIRAIGKGDCASVHRLLKNSQCSPADLTPHGFSLLSYATIYQSYDVYILLIKWGADPFFPNVTPISECAADLGWRYSFCYSIGETRGLYLRQTFPQPEFDDEGLPEIHKATLGISCSSLESVLQFCRSEVNRTDLDARTPLHLAAWTGRSQDVDALLRNGANVNARDNIEKPPLHHAALSGATDALRALLAAGADPDAIDRWKLAPLHIASAFGYYDIVQTLLQAGADPRRTDFQGTSPLAYALRRGSLDIVTSLIEAGVNLNTVDVEGFTPMFWAVCANAYECIKFLLAAGCRYHTNARNGQTLLHVTAQYADPKTLALFKELCMFEFDSRAKCSHGFTPRDEFELRKRNCGADKDVSDAFESLLCAIDQHREREIFYDAHEVPKACS